MTLEMAVGIDLGTTHSYFAYTPRAGDPRVSLLKNRATQPPGYAEDAGRWAAMPSRIAMRKQRDGITYPIELYHLGPDDLLDRLGNPDDFTVITRFKRLLGRSLLGQLGDEYRIGKRRTSEHEEDVYALPEGITAYLLWLMKRKAEQNEPAFSNTQIDHITITVPAKSKVSQRRATQFAARVAGFPGEIYVLEEPVAAFLHHYHQMEDFFKRQKDQYVFVLDFGGGTCDLSLIQIGGDERLPIVAARQMGDFGGEDIDDLIIDKWILRAPQDRRITKGEITTDGWDTLRAAARRAKESLTTREQSPTESIGYVTRKPVQFGARTLNRSTLRSILETESIETKFNDVDPRSAPIMTLIRQLTEALIREAEVKDHQIKAVILAGGSSKLLPVRELITERFSWLSTQEIIDRNSEACIAMGAAIHQYRRHHRDKSLRKTVTPTLASEIRLDHSFNSTTAAWGEPKILAKAKDPLPIKKDGLFNSEWVSGIKKYNDEIRIRIVQGEDDTDPLLDSKIPAKRLPVAWLRVRYNISEDGIIEGFRCSPAHLLRPPLFVPRSRKISEDELIRNEERLDGILEEYDLENSSRIRRLREQYGISTDS